jgi:hypothetical protein
LEDDPNESRGDALMLGYDEDERELSQNEMLALTRAIRRSLWVAIFLAAMSTVLLLTLRFLR